MNLKKLRAVKTASAPSNQSKLKTTIIKTGEVITSGPFEAGMLKAWIDKHADSSIFKYHMVAA